MYGIAKDTFKKGEIYSMSMIGPQVGGISLLFHILVIGFTYIKTTSSKLKVGVTNFSRKVSHPSRPNAK